MASFEGRVALVTGAASGIGAATAALFAERGASVLCADVNEGGANEVARALQGTSAKGICLDVRDEPAWERAMAAVQEAFGKLDVVAHCAGISAGGPVYETSLDEWRRVLAVNLDGAFLAVKHGIRAMRDRGGAVVLIGSASGVRLAAGAAAYSTSKAALTALAKTAAKECREADVAVRVNVVSPAGVKTAMWRSMPFFQTMVQNLGSEEAAFAALAGPHGTFSEPRDVAEAIAFLASDASRHVTGVELVVDGGYVL